VFFFFSNRFYKVLRFQQCLKETRETKETSKSEIIQIKKLQIQPEGECELSAPLCITLEFTSEVEIAEANWNLRFVVDYANKRLPLDVLSLPQHIQAGTNSTKFQVPELNVNSVDQLALPNIAMFVLTLAAPDGKEILLVKLVTHASKKEGKLYRIIYNPFEGRDGGKS